jgi:3-phosphoglycerate kinase
MRSCTAKEKLTPIINTNLSLEALEKVVSALAEGNKHIPYRNSKLTKLLSNALGSNCKTVILAHISPTERNYNETLTTLRFANKAKNVKNISVINARIIKDEEFRQSPNGLSTNVDKLIENEKNVNEEKLQKEQVETKKKNLNKNENQKTKNTKIDQPNLK